MKKATAVDFLLLLAASVPLGCGSGGSNRQLQSITINAVANTGQIQFVATGTYNTSPMTVTPLPTSWSVRDPSAGYTLTTQPFVIPCTSPGPVTAMAPVDPRAPRSGSVSSTKMIVANTPILCP